MDGFNKTQHNLNLKKKLQLTNPQYVLVGKSCWHFRKSCWHLHLFSLIKSSNELQGAVLTPRQLVERCGWAPAVEPDRSSRWWRVFLRSLAVVYRVILRIFWMSIVIFLLPPFTVCKLSWKNYMNQSKLTIVTSLLSADCWKLLNCDSIWKVAKQMWFPGFQVPCQGTIILCNLLVF